MSNTRTNHYIRFLDKFIERYGGGGPVGLLLGQIDVFNRISTTFGYGAADDFLADYVKDLRTHIPAGAQVIRLSGRRFVIVLKLKSISHVIDLARTITQELRPSLQSRFTVDISLGIAAHPTHAEDGANLLRRAELALRDAHEQRQPFELYKPNTTHRVATLWKTESELDAAIAAGALTVDYQPKVTLGDGSVLGLEALVRWSTVNGPVAPESFIPIAESKGSIVPLTWLVFDRVAGWVHGRDDLLGSLEVAINVTPQVLVHSDFGARVHDVSMALAEVNARLVIEITEDSLLKSERSSVRALERLRENGIGIALDDFGKGYSSLTYLKQIPATELKVDRQFVATLHSDRADQHIVRSIVDLAHALDMWVVAEGVDCRQNWEVVAQLGCDGAQGFFVSHPLPPASMLSWLEKRSHEAPWLAATKG